MAYDHIYLSPHLDDAIFSCGGRINQQRQRGERLLVLSSFTASPSAEQLSDFDWMRYDAETRLDIFAAARAEDQAVMQALGVDYIHLDYNIAMHRRDQTGQSLYPGIAKYGAIHPEDYPLLDTLAETFAQLQRDNPGATFYAPLAIGGHIDHMLFNHAAHRLPVPVRFYEDFPYVLFGRAGQVVFRFLRFLTTMGIWRPFDNPDAQAYPMTWPLVMRTFGVSPRLMGGPRAAHNRHNGVVWQRQMLPINLHTKIYHAGYYTKQIELLFGSQATLAHALTIYAYSLGRSHGVNIPHECVWLASPA